MLTEVDRKRRERPSPLVRLCLFISRALLRIRAIHAQRDQDQDSDRTTVSFSLVRGESSQELEAQAQEALLFLTSPFKLNSN